MLVAEVALVRLVVWNFGLGNFVLALAGLHGSSVGVLFGACFTRVHGTRTSMAFERFLFDELFRTIWTFEDDDALMALERFLVRDNGGTFFTRLRAFAWTFTLWRFGNLPV